MQEASFARLPYQAETQKKLTEVNQCHLRKTAKDFIKAEMLGNVLLSQSGSDFVITLIRKPAVMGVSG